MKCFLAIQGTLQIIDFHTRWKALLLCSTFNNIHYRENTNAYIDLEIALFSTGQKKNREEKRRFSVTNDNKIM